MLSEIRKKNYLVFGLVLLCVFLGFEIFIRSFDLYRWAPLVDIPSHFFSGLALGVLFYWLFSLKNIDVFRKKTYAVIYSCAVAVAWEFVEYAEDRVIENPWWLRDYFFWDGFWDIFFTTLGSFIVLFYLDYFFRRKN